MDTISPSQITAYLACPRKFAFRYVEGVTAEFRPAGLAFGAAVHGALERFHQTLLSGETPTADEIALAFRTDWAAEVAGDLRLKDGEDVLALAEQGETLVRLYMAEHADLKVVAAEWPFRVPLADPENGEVIGPDLKGIFDLVLDGNLLVEIKTAARAYDEGTLARNLQFSAYAYAYRALVGQDPTVRVVALLKQKKPRIDRYEVSRGAEGDAWFVALAAEVARGIMAGAYPPNPGWMCGECEYQTACAAWRGRVSRVVPADDRRHLPVVEATAL